MNDNGKWQLAFWIVTALFGIIFLTGFYFMGNNIIANDKAARERDDKITSMIYVQYQEIVQRLTRIETLVKK